MIVIDDFSIGLPDDINPFLNGATTRERKEVTAEELMSNKTSKFIQIPTLRGTFEIRDLLRIIKPYGFVCGGYARFCCSPAQDPFPATDVDVYAYTDDDFEKLKEVLGGELDIHQETKFSVHYNRVPKIGRREWAKPSMPVVNLIKPVVEARVISVGSMEDVLTNFDFTVTRAALIDTETALVDEDFQAHELARRLVLRNIHCPITSTLRTIKYCMKGYKISATGVVPLFLDWDARTPEYRKEVIDHLAEVNRIGIAMEHHDKGDVEAFRDSLNDLTVDSRVAVESGDKSIIGSRMISFYELMGVD